MSGKSDRGKETQPSQLGKGCCGKPGLVEKGLIRQFSPAGYHRWHEVFDSATENQHIQLVFLFLPRCSTIYAI